MVFIEDKTEEKMDEKKRNLKKLELIEEHFGNHGHGRIFESGIVLADNKGELLVLSPANYEEKVKIYTPKISKEELEKFGKEYEKRFGIDNLRFELDYSKYQGSSNSSKI